MKKTQLVVAMVIALAMSAMAPAMATEHCLPTDAGTANFVNTVPTEPFDVTCDIGIYFDEDGTIDGVDINGTVDDARPVQYGIYIDGVDVDVTNSTVTVAETYPHQFVSVMYRDGAAGTFDSNQLSGAHRAALVLRGAGTDVGVADNTFEGIGPKDAGWAQNGVQVDQGATGTITSNHISGHWWDKDDFLSSGLIVFGGVNVTAGHNQILNNDAGIAVSGGDGNNFIHNTVEVDFGTATFHFGAVIYAGDANGIRQNAFTSVNGSVGVYNQGSKTKLIRNSFTGWGTDVVDAGTGTVQPKPFQ